MWLKVFSWDLKMRPILQAGILVMIILSGWLMHSKHLQSCFERFLRSGLMNRYVSILALLVSLNYTYVRCVICFYNVDQLFLQRCWSSTCFGFTCMWLNVWYVVSASCITLMLGHL